MWLKKLANLFDVCNHEWHYGLHEVTLKRKGNAFCWKCGKKGANK
jgi:hypothetical protein